MGQTLAEALPELVRLAYRRPRGRRSMVVRSPGHHRALCHALGLGETPHFPRIAPFNASLLNASLQLRCLPEQGYSLR